MESTPLAKFITAHGGNPIFLDDQTTALLPDGAAVLGYGNPLVGYQEPPTDPIANLRARKLYLTTAIKYKSKLFHDLKSSVHQQNKHHLQNPSVCPPAGPHATQALLESKAEVDKLQEQYGEIEAELNSKKVGPTLAEQIAANREAHAREIREQMEEQNAITID